MQIEAWIPGTLGEVGSEVAQVSSGLVQGRIMESYSRRASYMDLDKIWLWLKEATCHIQNEDTLHHEHAVRCGSTLSRLAHEIDSGVFMEAHVCVLARACVGMCMCMCMCVCGCVRLCVL